MVSQVGGGLSISGSVTLTDSEVFSNVVSIYGTGVYTSGSGFLFLSNSFIYNDTIENPAAGISYCLLYTSPSPRD